MLAPWLSGAPPALRVALTLAVAALAVRAWRRHRTRFRRIACRASGWTLTDAAGVEHPALLETHARLGALLALVFRHGPRARFHVVLAPDNLDAATRRQLLLLLARAGIAHAA